MSGLKLNLLGDHFAEFLCEMMGFSEINGTNVLLFVSQKIKKVAEKTRSAITSKEVEKNH